ncbi:MAG: hypothetical protein JRH11_24515 [Deltaproteobacteria bacterium]|nr:hypothetical protein [Deltaproteobacteria bacterium]
MTIDTAPLAPESAESDSPESAFEGTTETCRVQVIAQWNSWVQVYNPSDESVTWVDLGETQYAPA